MEHLRTLSQDSLLHFPPLSPPLWKKLVDRPETNITLSINRVIIMRQNRSFFIAHEAQVHWMTAHQSHAGHVVAGQQDLAIRKKRRISLSTNSVLKLFLSWTPPGAVEGRQDGLTHLFRSRTASRRLAHRGSVVVSVLQTSPRDEPARYVFGVHLPIDCWFGN